jgi:hypothetical protein
MPAMTSSSSRTRCTSDSPGRRRPWVFGLSHLEQVKDVLRAQRGPTGEQMVIRIGEGATPPDRHEVGYRTLSATSR